MRLKIFGWLIIFALVFTTIPSTAHAQDTTLTIFAAASLTDAFEEIGGVFESANPGVNVEFQFAVHLTSQHN